VSRWTSSAPAARRARAHAAAVAPVVRTSSTRRMRGGARTTARNAPCMADRRSVPRRAVWGSVSLVRTRSRRLGIPVLRATIAASAAAWSYPRAARRLPESGTQVRRSAELVDAAAMARPSASATERQPSNFSRSRAERAGPVYRKGARAVSISGAGQWRHRASSSSAGIPQIAHSGGERTTRSRRHATQKGHAPAPPNPHPAQRGGNSTSRILPGTARPYRVPVTRPGAVARYGSLTVMPEPFPRALPATSMRSVVCERSSG
jgi:hypothetical protein